MTASTQETQVLVSPDSEELLVAPDSEELRRAGAARELLVLLRRGSRRGQGKSTGKPAMEFTPESELNAPDERHAAKEQKKGPPARA